MTWKIEFEVRAEKEFDKLSHDIQKAIYKYLSKNVAKSPRNYGKPIKGIWYSKIMAL